MAQSFETAAGAEADVIETAPDNSQGNNVASEVEAPEGEQTTEQTLYADDQPIEGEVGDEQQQDEDGEGEDEAPDPVDAPASLKAEEKEQFAQLPPEAQRVLSEVLSRRDHEIQQGLEAARSAQREAERTAADQAAQVQQRFAEQFDGLVQAFQPTPPPLELARQNPAEYQYRKALFDEENATFQQLVGQISGLKDQSAQHFEAQRQTWLQEQVTQLRSIPEFADESTRPEFQRQIAETAKGLGYTDEELAAVSAKDVIALNKIRVALAKAEKWDRHQAKRNERPRAAQGRFAAAPVGNGTSPQGQSSDPLKALYPND